MKSTYLFTLLMLLSISLLGCSGDSDLLSVPDDISSSAELTAVMQDIVANTEVPGFAISIVDGNTVLYQEAFGYADLQQQVPYTNETVQHLASISKTFVAAAVVHALEAGLFTLETDINDILPLAVMNPRHPSAPIKVKHLVTHTSGLLDNQEIYITENYYILPGEDLSTPGADLLYNGIGIPQRSGRALEDFLAEYYLAGGEMYSLDNFAGYLPGEAWAYSNVATALAAYLIEVTSGKTFYEYVRTNVLAPLGMQHSTYNLMEVDRSRLAKWYIDKETPLPLYDNDSYPEGSMYTTNEDMGRYLLDMARGVQGKGNTLFSAAGYELLFENRLPEGMVPAGFAENHGIFWYSQNGLVQHGGNSLGVSTHLEINRATGKGYVLMTNMDATLIGNEGAYEDVATRIDQAIDAFLNAQ